MNSNPAKLPKELLPNYFGASNSVKECEDKEMQSSEDMYYVEGSYTVEVGDTDNTNKDDRDIEWVNVSSNGEDGDKLPF